MTQKLEDIKTKLYGKTARGFNLTWEPEENTFVITLTSKNKDIVYFKKIKECNWSFFPFTEKQTKVLETKILGSNLDMWICYQKMTEFILWFMGRNITPIGGMYELKKNSIFSSGEYDYLMYMKLPNWDLYSKPDNPDYYKGHKRCKECYSKDYKDKKPSYDDKKDYMLKYNYGEDFGLEQYKNTLQEQNELCAICFFNPNTNGRKDSNNLYVDHDHKTGKIRGLLCSNCNRMLGLVGDNIGTLSSAILYLQKHQ